ncbi:MAG TPA: hypothetical protein VGZ29_05725 [Terriglobia bacterium]|nr:hypothetical protein [Terriglobia bacterium]
MNRKLGSLILLSLLLSQSRAVAQVAFGTAWNRGTPITAVGSFEGKIYSMLGVQIWFPSTDATIYNCTAGGGVSCYPATGSGAMSIGPDTGAPLRITIFQALCSQSALTSGQSLDLRVTFWVPSSTTVGTKLPTGGCGAAVTGNATITGYQNVCSTSFAAPPPALPSVGGCIETSTGYLGQSTVTCSSGTCQVNGTAYSYARQGTWQTLRYVLTAGTGTATPGELGGHVGA